MPWVKFSDDWYDDPKIIAAGDTAALLWVKAVSWSARNLTDGLIPAELLPRLLTSPDTPTIASRLIDLGLFVEDISGGYQIANFLEYQKSRAEVMEAREKEAERKRNARASTSGNRPSGRGPDSGDRPPSPDPDPVPDEKPSSSSSVLPLDTVLHGVRIEDVYEAVATMRAAARTDLKNPKRWQDRVKANLPEQIEADVVRAIEAFDEPAHTIAEVVEGKRNKQYLRRRNALEVVS